MPSSDVTMNITFMSSDHPALATTSNGWLRLNDQANADTATKFAVSICTQGPPCANASGQRAGGGRGHGGGDLPD